MKTLICTITIILSDGTVQFGTEVEGLHMGSDESGTKFLVDFKPGYAKLGIKGQGQEVRWVHHNRCLFKE